MNPKLICSRCGSNRILVFKADRYYCYGQCKTWVVCGSKVIEEMTDG